ncbi:cuticle collagen 1-like isoform X2 [Fukomys damarensis]|uniref:cuticle collagen 1-like isoform X2 n=1 Tax=Fukomys damarensis TaxID=885580 RepID=UPI00053FA2AA|nr:cuticle collagen 1-like isoform X2 [Fukomys damarensis]
MRSPVGDPPSPPAPCLRSGAVLRPGTRLALTTPRPGAPWPRSNGAVTLLLTPRLRLCHSAHGFRWDPFPAGPGAAAGKPWGTRESQRPRPRGGAQRGHCVFRELSPPADLAGQPSPAWTPGEKGEHIKT